MRIEHLWRCMTVAAWLAGSAMHAEEVETPMLVTVCPRVVVKPGDDPEEFIRRVEDLFVHKTGEWRYVSENISHYKFYATPLVWMAKREPELLETAVKSITGMGLGIAIEVGIRKGHGSVEESLLDPVTEAGGRVDFIITDNVFIKSQHRFKDQYGWSYEEAVDKYSDFVAGIKKRRPDLKVGLLEAAFRFHWEDRQRFPPERRKNRANLGDLRELVIDVMEACEAKGTRLDIFQPEYSYERIEKTENGWAKLKAMERFCRERGLEFHFLFNDHTGGNHSDKLFHENVMECLRAVKSHGLTPALGTIQSWYPHPAHDLPEDQPHTFMYLAAEFIRETNR